MDDSCCRCSRRKISISPKQLYLAQSRAGDLVLAQQPARKPRPGSSISTALEPPISRIPEELLREIISLAVAQPDRKPWEPEDYAPIIVLSSVSRLWNGIVQPLLFKIIRVPWPHSLAPACIPFKMLHRTIKSSPRLGTFCKRTHFHIPSISFHKPTAESFAVADSLLSLLPNVVEFSLHGGFGHAPTWPLLWRAFQHMPHLKDLTLSRESWDLHIDAVIKGTPLSRLQSLSLHGISCRKDGVRPHSIKDLARTSPITELEISDWGETLDVLHDLIRIPRALEHLRISTVGGTRATALNILPTQRLLDEHRTSLQSIEIGYGGPEVKGINLLNYPELETLHISRWNSGLTPEVASSTLIAPKLHTFIWDFTIIDQHSESLETFGEVQKEWVIRFGKLAAERKSLLRNIKIVFTPDFWPDQSWTVSNLQETVLPWELMEEARDALRPLGVKLSYNTQEGWTRQEILEEIEASERETGSKQIFITSFGS